MPCVRFLPCPSSSAMVLGVVARLCGLPWCEDVSSGGRGTTCVWRPMSWPMYREAEREPPLEPAAMQRQRMPRPSSHARDPTMGMDTQPSASAHTHTGGGAAARVGCVCSTRGNRPLGLTHGLVHVIGVSCLAPSTPHRTCTATTCPRPDYLLTFSLSRCPFRAAAPVPLTQHTGRTTSDRARLRV